MKIKKLTKDDVSITIEAQEEHVEIRGQFASGDDKFDEETAQEIERQLNNGNEWAWCCVRVMCEFNGLEATDYLGCCSYKDEKDFVENSGYYEDMVQTCINDLQEQIEGLVKEVATCE